ncbi:formylmethanofuran dehydrogenase subunit B [Rhodopirellula maiorica SM1]|uniref:Formylmethanofuran dehydrogenase subunit B n=1 Tax=Rhodopirellula maiorica SM1 TaxID=1265738 RepID=M5RNT0_9BACT|nr:formylmethanofuran dehydrogenase subunit B [Rhodopirellula maiorica]EMI20846.1 formylmethanofuran dehydrogenase subunit B [Rhodopirellula maiorica SM1]
MPPTLHVCPFCPLHCDDVSLEPSSEAERIVNVQCAKAITGYTKALSGSQSARIADSAVTTALASKQAKEILAGNGVIHVATTGTDLDTARRLNQLQRENRIRIAVDDSISTAAWRAAVSREGTLSATLGDVRRHADVVWTIGDVDSETPRLRERISADTKECIQSNSLAAEPLAELFYAIRTDTPGSDSNKLTVASIASANYLAVILGRNAFVASEAAATSEMLSKLLWYLNKTRRAIVLKLDAAATNRAVTAWQTNRLVPSVAGDLRHEIHVRLGSPEVGTGAAKMQIGGIDRGRKFAEVFLPAATMGIDRDGVAVRGDATVTIPLAAICPSRELTAIELLEQSLG